MRLSILVALSAFCGLASALAAEEHEGIPFPRVGKIAPRQATDINGSNWSVGAETMDRDFTSYDNWKEYLGPIYEGGGQARLMGGVPTSGEARDAWAKWVRANVERYKEVIREWEVWNEPNYRVPAADYARLLILTAETVRCVQPDSVILAMSLGSGVDYKYADKVLAILAEQDKVQLVGQVTYHRHRPNPDPDEPERELEKVVAKYSDRIVIRQGEAGCPSQWCEKRALNRHHWTELTQSKHVLRRLLADLGRGRESSVFGIVDMKYPDEMNRKGLLLARDDLTVERPKQAYYAVQNLASVFDDRLERIRDYPVRMPDDLPLTVFGYEHRASGGQVVTVWFHNAIPSDSNAKTPVDLTFARGRFTDPVYVDLRTGHVYEVPEANREQEGMVHRFKAVPCYDSPILIADKQTLFIAP